MVKRLDAAARPDLDPVGGGLERLVGERARRHQHASRLRIAATVELGVVADLHEEPARRLAERVVVADVPGFLARQQFHLAISSAFGVRPRRPSVPKNWWSPPLPLATRDLRARAAGAPPARPQTCSARFRHAHHRGHRDRVGAQRPARRVDRGRASRCGTRLRAAWPSICRCPARPAASIAWNSVLRERRVELGDVHLAAPDSVIPAMR